MALEWFEKNYASLPGCGEIEKNRAWFAEAERALGEKLPPFDLSLREYLYRQLRRSLKIDDLRFFFQFHPALQRLSLRQLLPFRWLKKLKEARWPGRLEIKGMDIPIEYIDGRPFLKLDHAQFHRLEAADIRLPSGEAPGFLLQGERFAGWAEAAAAYNAKLKERDIPAQVAGREKKRPGRRHPGDPLSRSPSRAATARTTWSSNSTRRRPSRTTRSSWSTSATWRRPKRYYATVAEDWEKRKARFRKESVENIFRGKGWKVK